MPPVAASERGTVTPSVISRKARNWAALAGWPGSSAHIRCDMTSAGPVPPSVRAASASERIEAHSAGSKPSRFMPVSSWIAKGARGRRARSRKNCSGLFSTGISPVRSCPGMCPDSTKMRASGASRGRIALPSEACATKKSRAPAA